MLNLICVFLFGFTSPANLPPIPTDDVYTGDWSHPLVVPANAGVLANDIDPDGDTLSAHLRQSPEHGTLALNRDGGFTYQPDYGFSGQVAFVYKAWDGTEGREATVTLEIEPGNLAPVAEDDAFTVILGERLTIKGPGVKNNDHDPEGAPLTAYLLTTPVVGHLGFHEDGGFWFEDLGQLAHGQTTSFTYKVVDDYGNRATATVFLNAQDPNGNRAPVITSQPPTTTEILAPYHYPMTVEDDPGDTHVFAVVHGPPGLSLSPQGVLSWVPDFEDGGSHPITLSVTDAAGLTAEQAFTLVVAGEANQPPQITSTAPTYQLLQGAVGEGQPVDLRPWTYQYWDQNTQPRANWVIDETGTEAVQTINAQPSAMLSDFEVTDTLIEGTWFVDPDWDDDYIGFVFGYQDDNHMYMFTWKAQKQSSAQRGMSLRKYDRNADGIFNHWATQVRPIDGETLWTNDISWYYNRDYHFSLQFHPGEITISVRHEQETLAAFTVYDATYTTGKFGFYNNSQNDVHYRGFTREILGSRTYQYAARGLDPEGRPLRWQLVDGPRGCTIDPATGILQWQTNSLQIGTHAIAIRLIDDQGAYDEQQWNVVVANEAPIIFSEPGTVARVSQTYQYAPLVIDPTPNDTHVFTLNQGPEGMTIDPAGGVLSFTPTPSQVGNHPVTLSVTDNAGHTTNQTFVLEVVPNENQPPQWANHLPTVWPRQKPFLVRLQAIDPEGETLSYHVVETTHPLAVNAAGLIAADIPPELETLEITVAAVDPQGLATLQSTAIAIFDNQPPEFVQLLPTRLFAGHTYQGRLTATDPDTDPLTWNLLYGPEGLSLDSNGDWTWSPTAEQVGDLVARVAVSDGNYAPSAPMTVRVEPFANSAPILTGTPPDHGRLELPFQYFFQAEDAENDPITFSVEGPTGMVFDETGLLSWPNPIEGSHDITVSAGDPFGEATHHTWTLTITPNGAPVFTSLPAIHAAPGTTYQYQPQFSDPEDDAVFLDLTTAPQGMILADNTLQYEAQTLGTFPVELTATDALGAITTQAWTLTVSQNQPPRFTSTPTLTAQIHQTWTYPITTVDEDGQDVTLALEEGPPGMVLNGQTLSFTPDTTGQFAVRLSATDPLGATGEQSFTLTVLEDANRPPIITSTPHLITGIGEPYTYQATAVDPESHPIAWTLIQAPEGLTLNPISGRLTWTATDLGTYQVVLTVEDLYGAATRQNFYLQVQHNTIGAPSFASTPPTEGFVGVPYHYDAEVAAKGVSLKFELIEGPEGLTLDPSRGIIQWTPEPTQLGNHALGLRVSDYQGGTDTQHWTIQVGDPGDITPPEVFVNLDQNRVDPNQVVTIAVAASDDQGVSDIAASINGTPIALDASRQATFSSPEPGIYHVRATATDSAGNSADHGQDIWVSAPEDLEPPVVTIHTPTRDTTLTTPQDVWITAQDPNLAQWTLEVGRTGRDCWTPIASGQAEVSNAPVGVFDTSLLPNGLYTLRLTAYDVNGSGLVDEAVYAVEGAFKVGRFTMGFRDLDIPLRGIPVQINRVYDSTDKCPGDFGYGWRLADAEIQASITLGRHLEVEEKPFCDLPSGPVEPPGDNCPIPSIMWCTDAAVPHYVNVTLAGGATHQFDLQLSVPDNGDVFNGTCRLRTPLEFVKPTFTARSNTTSTLELVDDSRVLFRLILNDDGTSEYMALDSNGDPWNPALFRLTTTGGTVFIIHKDQGIQEITDLEGNRLTISANAVTHSSGLAVTIGRDEQGRIKSVTDPDNGTITYDYDERGDLKTVTDRMGQITTYRYDDYHNLIEIQTPDGTTPAKQIYDEDGRLSAREDAYGNRIEFTHDPNNPTGRREVVTDRLGNQTVYIYDDWGQVTQKTDPLGRITRFEYDANHNETKQIFVMANGAEAITEREFDDDGNQLWETDPTNRTIEFTYTGRNQPEQITTAAGQSILTYDSHGRPKTIRGPTNALYSVDYRIEAGRLIIETTDPENNTTSVIQDHRGYVVEEIDAEGIATTYTHDNRGNVLTETRLGRTWTREYDAGDRLRLERDPEGHETQYEYDPNGQQIAVIDPLGHRTETVYDARGNAVKVIYPDGTESNTGYDAEGNVITETDRQGRITEFTYDATGQQIAVTYPDGTTTGTDYDNAGRPQLFTDQRGNQTTKEYDLAGRTTAVINALNFRSEYHHNEVGLVRRFTDAKNHHTDYAYDGRGLLEVTTRHDGTTITQSYDGLGRRRTLIDPMGFLTQFGYDPRGNLNRVTDALNGITRFEYQPHERRQIDALNRTTTWILDDLNREQTRVLPMGQTERWTYTATSRLETHTDFEQQTTEYFYDSNDRERERIYHDGETVTTTYTPTGQRATVTNHRGLTRFHYDLMDRLIHVEYPNGQWITYGYDAAGNRTEITTAEGTTSFTFDALNRLSTVRDPQGRLTAYEYDSVGNLEVIHHPNGITTTHVYDALNRLEYMEHTAPDGTILASFDYTLDEAGRRRTVTDHTGRTTTYTYDQLHRLLEERIEAATGTTTYGYDLNPVGNRRSKTVNGITTTYAFDDNDRLERAGETTFTYDANGSTKTRTINGETTRYTYNGANRLVAAETPDGTQLGYEYDADGTRVSATTDGQTTDFLIDTNRAYAQVLEERKGSHLTAQYTHGHDLLAQTRLGETHSYLKDGHGNTIALADDSATVTDTYQYEAYGTEIGGTGNTSNPYRYTGEQHDNGLGMVYLRARYYNPEIGRFHTMDTWRGNNVQPITLHKYLYANANPVMGLDPSGNFTLSELMVSVGIGATVGAVGSAIHSYAIGEVITAKSLLTGAAFGAVLGPLAMASPTAAVAIGAYGAISNVELTLNVVFNEDSTLGQKLAASTLVLSSISGPKASSLVSKARIARAKQLKLNKILGNRSVKNFISFLEANGINVKAQEVYVRSPFYTRGRRYDLVIEHPTSGKLVGIEVKSSSRAFSRNDPSSRAQFSADKFVNNHGGRAFGRAAKEANIEGRKIHSAIKVEWR